MSKKQWKRNPDGSPDMRTLDDPEPAPRPADPPNEPPPDWAPAPTTERGIWRHLVRRIADMFHVLFLMH